MHGEDQRETRERRGAGVGRHVTRPGWSRGGATASALWVVLGAAYLRSGLALYTEQS